MMPNIDVNTERLRKGAEALRLDSNGLGRAAAELDSGTAIGSGGVGHGADGGVGGALHRLRDSWDYDIGAFQKDIEAFAQMIDTLAELYGSADHDNAQQLRG